LRTLRKAALGEYVGGLGGHRDVENTNISDGNSPTDKVEIDLSMLGALMLDEVDGVVDHTYVVAIDQGGL
jgi:hypothetical protein